MNNFITDDQIKENIKKQRAEERKRKWHRIRITVIVIALILAVVDGMLLGKALGNKKYAAEVGNAQVSADAGGAASKLSALFGEDLTPDDELVSVTEDIPIVNTAKELIGNKGGDKFWSWYGFGSHVAWCGCFVSYCESEAGYLSDGTGVKFAYCPDGVSYFKKQGRWLNAGETPKAGDIIFFDWEQSGGVDHTGVVSAVIDDKVYTIEGNSSDRCRIKRYYLNDAVIFGYGQA